MSEGPQILVLDNSPRGLGRRWFTGWLHRRLGCRVRVVHNRHVAELKRVDGFDGLVISGSPASATEDSDWILHELDLLEQADTRGLPVLGVCFGSQLLGRAYYGRAAVRRAARPEFGWHTVQRAEDDPLFEGVPAQFTSFQYHMEEVVCQPGMKRLAGSVNAEVQAFRVGSKPTWGLQFHLEVTPRAGADLLRRTRSIYERLDLEYEMLIRAAQPNAASERLFRNFIRFVE